MGKPEKRWGVKNDERGKRERKGSGEPYKGSEGSHTGQKRMHGEKIAGSWNEKENRLKHGRTYSL